MRLLLDLIRPSSGTRRYSGSRLTANSVEIRRRVGFSAGRPGDLPEAVGPGVLDFLAELRGGVDRQAA